MQGHPCRKETNQSYNGDLMNNLIDGIPVAVFVKYPGIGYINHGLAYVERFDALTQIFTLHGPVSAEAHNVDFCSILPYEQLTEEEQRLFRDADEGDLRKRVLAEQVRREKQGEFRKMVLDAYSGKCAVTKTDVSVALQAAHIDPYRGKQSQIVTNGILLRSDIHLLYDAHLLTILPEKRIIRIGKQLESSTYRHLNGSRIDVPEDPLLQPDDAFLEIHAREFSLVEKNIGAA